MKNLVVLLSMLTLLSGCATLSPEEKSAVDAVKVTDLSYLNTEGQKCTNLGAVQGSSVGAVGGQSAAIEKMKLSASALGANVVVSNMSFSPTMGIFAPAELVKGIAMNCPNDLYAKVVSIEQLAIH